uniref:THAP-type domain-containing protein n=1 Tax=Esox lucius TaxID=8010 RepID=A0A3P8YMA2_ESOLU
MPHCAAFGCNFQSKGNEGSSVSLHCFLHEKIIRKQWEVACGRVQLPKDPRLCSRHFSPDAFEALSRLKELKPNAPNCVKVFMCCDTRSICKYNQSILF